MIKIENNVIGVGSIVSWDYGKDNPYGLWLCTNMKFVDGNPCDYYGYIDYSRSLNSTPESKMNKFIKEYIYSLNSGEGLLISELNEEASGYYITREFDFTNPKSYRSYESISNANLRFVGNLKCESILRVLHVIRNIDTFNRSLKIINEEKLSEWIPGLVFAYTAESYSQYEEYFIYLCDVDSNNPRVQFSALKNLNACYGIKVFDKVFTKDEIFKETLEDYYTLIGFIEPNRLRLINEYFEIFPDGFIAPSDSFYVPNMTIDKKGDYIHEEDTKGGIICI